VIFLKGETMNTGSHARGNPAEILAGLGESGVKTRRRMTVTHAARFVSVSLFLTGCAATSPSGSPSSPSASTGEPRAQAPRVASRNLGGYSTAFRQGYVEGCDSAGSGTRQRDEGRYKSDLDYLMGWNDGYSVCRR
jgi:hypothetical protein